MSLPNVPFLSQPTMTLLECGSYLTVMVTRTVIEDTDVVQYGVYFDCGHSLSQMEKSLVMGEYI